MLYKAKYPALCIFLFSTQISHFPFVPFKYLFSLLATLPKERDTTGLSRNSGFVFEKLMLQNGIDKMSGTESRFSIGHLKLEIFED